MLIYISIFLVIGIPLFASTYSSKQYQNLFQQVVPADSAAIEPKSTVHAKQIEGLYRKNILKAHAIELKIVKLKPTIPITIKGRGKYTLIKDRTTLIEVTDDRGGWPNKAVVKNRQATLNKQLQNLSEITQPVLLLLNTVLFIFTLAHR